MKKFFSIFLILFVCKLFTAAQVTGEFIWKEYSPALEEFTVTVPSNFDSLKFDEKNPDITRIYKSFLNGTYLFIASGKDSDSAPYNSIVSLAMTNKAVKKNSKIDSRAAEEFDFSDSEGFFQKVVAVKTGSRFYIFYSVSEKQDNAETKKFFSSIKFRKKPSTENPPATAQTKTETPVNIPPPTEKQQTGNNPTKTTDVPLGLPNAGGIGDGSGSGYGNGNGVGAGGDGIGNGVRPMIGGGAGIGNSDPAERDLVTKPIIKPFTSVKILSKQPAKYSTLARIFGLEGNVMLRVTFLANGTIGSITPVKKLPFGLTDSAISAAKSIRFEPATKNGVAYSVSKTVQYNFTIY